MKTEEKTLFTIDELSDSAREKALDKMREFACEDSFWYEQVIDDAKEIGEMLGIDIDKVYFSGFYSQGDGACFEGEYRYKKGSVKAIEQRAPRDTGLHAIARALYRVQARNFFGLSAAVKHRGHYHHEMCTVIDIDGAHFDPSSDSEDDLKDALRDFMRWIYSQLEKEYEFRISDETLMEDAQANELYFDEDGAIQ